MLQPSEHRNSSNAADSSNGIEKEKDPRHEVEVQATKEHSSGVEDRMLAEQLEEMRLKLSATQAELELERQGRNDAKQNSSNTNENLCDAEEFSTTSKASLLEEIASLKHQYDELKNNTIRDTAEYEEVIEVQEQEIKALKSEHSSTLASLIEEKKKLEDTAVEMAKKTSDKVEAERQQQSQEQELVVHQLQAEIKELREKHASEMDEILIQLDEVEAEHAHQLKRVKEEVAVAAAQEQHISDNQVMEATEKMLRDRLEESQRMLRECQEAYAARQQEYEESLDVARREAADDARQEMIKQAESQFEQANEMYVQLKEEFAASLDTTAELQGELDEAHRALDTAHSDAAMQQESFQRQLDQLQQGTLIY